MAAGLGALNGGGAKSLAVAAAGFGTLDASHGEALAVMAAEATYLYRETKPSAPQPSRLKTLTLQVANASTADMTNVTMQVIRKNFP